MTGTQKLAVLALASVTSLVVGAVWMNEQATWLGGGLLVFGFIGSVLCTVSFRNKKGQ